jgi:DNA polymerase V
MIFKFGASLHILSNLIFCKMFALVDCNNFYASCERLFQPQLIGKPVCVLSNNDGCVIARSSEAKALGIPMGAPAFEWEKFFIQHDVAVFSANFELYGDMSNRVMHILSEFSPSIEVYSIDEMFLDFQGLEYESLEKIGQHIRKTVLQNTSIPVCIGFAPTKSLAKLANRIAKKYSQWNGIYTIDTEEKRIKALKWLRIEDVWGVGLQHAKRLKQANIHTALDFTNMDEGWVKKHMSIVGIRLQRDLSGKPTIQMEHVTIKKNIAITRSFERNYRELKDLEERISTFAVTCSEKLRKQGSECNALTVFIRTNRFRADLKQYNRAINLKLPFPTNSSIELSKFAVHALHLIFRSGFNYKKAGVIVNDLTPENTKQLELFESSNIRHKKLMKSVDQINQAFGQQKVRLAIQDQQRVWKMKQERLSPRYTTRLSDVIRVKS